MPETLKNILLIKPSSLGDVVQALPALTALRKCFPQAKISWLIRPEFAPLIQNHPHLNEIIFFDRKILGKAWHSPHALASLFHLIQKLRQSRFDAVVDLQGLFRTASLAWLTGCKKRFGPANAREFGSLFYTHKVRQNESSIHVVDFYLKIVKALGASDIKPEFVLPLDQSAADSVKRKLENQKISFGEYAVFVPGSLHPSKQWPIERFAELADKISGKFKLPIIAVGSAGEKGLIEKLTGLAKAPIINFAGSTNLPELVALLKKARIVVSNDTGPGHIAAVLGTPLVMMFSWSNPARIAPYGRTECMVAKEPYGRGTQIRSDDPEHNVEQITVDEVYQKVCEQLA
jgi:lipopolysaccharide heptosyltransferase I